MKITPPRTDKQGAALARRSTEDLKAGHIGAHIASELIRRGAATQVPPRMADVIINRAGLFKSYGIKFTKKGKR